MAKEVKKHRYTRSTSWENKDRDQMRGPRDKENWGSPTSLEIRSDWKDSFSKPPAEILPTLSSRIHKKFTFVASTHWYRHVSLVVHTWMWLHWHKLECWHQSNSEKLRKPTHSLTPHIDVNQVLTTSLCLSLSVSLSLSLSFSLCSTQPQTF